ncbi:hypothetical protein L195_g051645, partial [Trifolium pratense]
GEGWGALRKIIH